MTDTPDPIEVREALAGELALRVLTPEQDVAARAREAADPAFAAEVAVWNERLAGFVDEIAPVAPSAGLWPRIESGIGGAANDNGAAVFWRRWAIGSTGLLAASLAAAVFLAAQPARVVEVASPTPAVGVTRVATLALDDGAAAVTLVYEPTTGKLYIAPTREMAGDARVPHLWLVAPDGGVQLVGAIAGDHASTESLNRALSGPANSATALAVSMEAPGHTPDPHKPDGPVVASGEFLSL